MLGIIIAATKANGGTGPLMTSKTTISGSTYSWNWVYGIVSQYGSIAAGVTNMADYTRFSEKKYSPYPGTIISWFTLGVVIPLMGLITASAIEGRYGVTYWKPNDIMNLWLEDNYTPAVRAGVFFASMAFVSSQLVYNVMGNAIPGGMDMSGLCPQFINIRRGAYITALLSWVIQPWDFYNTSSTFVTVMSSFSVFMTPLIACWICDYFIIRKRKLKLSDLYSLEEGGEFWYWKGLNLRGLLAWACSSAPGIAGLVNQANTDLPISEGAKHFYDGNLFFGFVIAFFVYYVSNLIFPMKKLDELDQVDYFKIYTPEQIQQKGLISYEEYKAGVLPQEDDSVESGSASGSKEITQIEYELTGDKTATVEV
ncbi:hypothetical protein PACTADRAFT_49281 [Pachysolen tannophilus NRRL Y-2460]|uniref:Thiamine transporter n=1 Tax=Pachysolen tannophilus NRRL Y-2460 TaxID=669874 RepID=A0A1E4TVR9_PACTA|nr:hypothetical protein PACTADRAFT_49281 [Pachysolen tannophilus NRRL Y-2460]